MSSDVISLREWELSAPPVTDSVSVRNLHATVNAGVDVWGRQRQQPAQISVTIWLRQPFESAAVTDSIDKSTIHYGLLSKAMSADLESQRNSEWKNAFRTASRLRYIAYDMAKIQLCDVEVYFPKASMLGDGVSVSVKTHSDEEIKTRIVHLRNVRVSTVVGVNSNEREMKQSIVANVWFDGCNEEAGDCYHEAEQVLVKTIEESSFQTLESLALKVVSNLIKYFVLPISPGANVRLRLEKPSAVPFADAPAVEVYRRSSHDDPFGKKMLDELGWKVHRIPFPLKGQLSDHERSLQAYSQLGFRMSISDA